MLKFETHDHSCKVTCLLFVLPYYACFSDKLIDERIYDTGRHWLCSLDEVYDGQL